uniref:Uncharacterized protein n=1 Tax=Zea mays TaxID=4577 RepID=A0A804MTH2_MAIZE
MTRSSSRASTAVQGAGVHQHDGRQHRHRHRAAVPGLPQVPGPLPPQRVGDRGRPGDAGVRAGPRPRRRPRQLHQVAVQPVPQRQPVLRRRDRERGRLGRGRAQHQHGIRRLLAGSAGLQLGGLGGSAVRLRPAGPFVGGVCSFAGEVSV